MRTTSDETPNYLCIYRWSERRGAGCYAFVAAHNIVSCEWFTDLLTSLVRTIQFYHTPSGRSPVEEFLDSLSDKHAQKVAWVLRLVERFDMIPKQYFKKLVGTEDLWEIRVQIGGNSYRFLGFFDGSRLLILTSWFSKKQQKTPQREIDIANQRRTEYIQRR